MKKIKACALTTTFVLMSACASDFDRRTAALEKELKIQSEPVFPKCAAQETDPKVSAIYSRVGSGISNTIYDPVGNVPLDECIAYDHEVPGKDP